MEQREASCKGCLLGLAVGDAMGYAVDKKSYTEICEDYGPNGLLGYDLVNGTADVTSYTQIAAFLCNSLLLGAIRGNPERYSRFVVLGLREWAKSQQFRSSTEKTFCWLAQVPQMRRRLCMDTRILDALNREILGTPEKPVLVSDTPSALTAGVAVGLMYDPEKMSIAQVGTLAVESIACTHGDPETFLSGAVLAYSIAAILQDPQKPLATQFDRACQAMVAQFGETFPQAQKVSDLIHHAIELTKDPQLSPLAALALLSCTTAAECLAGSVYSSCIHTANFDEAMICAVNHSGRSCAVGAVTGAILGAKLGYEALPEFYLESLEAAPALQELAEDISQGKQVLRIFDDSWDHKYVQGLAP